MKAEMEYKTDLAESRCGIDRYGIEIPEFYDGRVWFFKGRLFLVQMSMKTNLDTSSEIIALAQRFVAKYGPPTNYYCFRSNEPAIEKHSLNGCEFEPFIQLTYESGPEGTAERYKFSVSIYSDDKRRGYDLNLEKGWKYYVDSIDSCREKTLLAIDEENAKKVTLPPP
jgi:hypothetical protein